MWKFQSVIENLGHDQLTRSVVLSCSLHSLKQIHVNWLQIDSRLAFIQKTQKEDSFLTREVLMFLQILIQILLFFPFWSKEHFFTFFPSQSKNEHQFPSDGYLKDRGQHRQIFLLMQNSFHLNDTLQDFVYKLYKLSYNHLVIMMMIQLTTLRDGLFTDNERNNPLANKRNSFKTPAGGRQTSWLFTRVTEELNSGLPNPLIAHGTLQFKLLKRNNHYIHRHCTSCLILWYNISWSKSPQWDSSSSCIACK